MSKLAALQAQAAQAAATGPNMTEVQKGGTSRLLPEGYALGRLVEYVELGSQPQEFKGVAKDPKPEARLGFALYGAGYENEDGTPYIIRPYAFSIDRNEKAKAYLLFKSLNWRGTATHFSQLLGEAFLIKIVHEAKSKTDATKVSRVDMKGFLPPLEALTKQPYAVPEARDEDLQLFLWEYPTLEAWNALYVAGNFDDGRSKNFTQETICGAVDFAGSALEALLLSTGAPVPKAAAKPVAATPALPAGPAMPVAPAAPAAGAPTVPFVPPVAPAAPPVTSPTPPAVTVPPVTTVTTSHSSPAMPTLPIMPNLPLPVLPVGGAA